MSAADAGLVAGASLFLAASIYILLLLPRSRALRTDLEAGDHFGAGSRPFWQLNVYNPRNYASGEGRRLVSWLRLARAAQLIGLVVALISLANR